MRASGTLTQKIDSHEKCSSEDRQGLAKGDAKPGSRAHSPLPAFRGEPSKVVMMVKAWRDRRVQRICQVARHVATASGGAQRRCATHHAERGQSNDQNAPTPYAVAGDAGRSRQAKAKWPGIQRSLRPSGRCISRAREGRDGDIDDGVVNDDQQRQAQRAEALHESTQLHPRA